MGINTGFAALLVRARQKGAVFGEVATIGRQSLAVPDRELCDLAQRVGLTDFEPSDFSRDGFAEDFLHQHLDARRITSFDVSDYQGVDHVHDFNQPIPHHLHGGFDSLIDGGAMEHIFDVRQVLANYLNMVKKGGHIFISTPANNLFGHGFYQFSPELFYRVFSEDNGCRVEEMCVVETPFFSVEVSRHQRCFHVADPADLGKRLRLVNDKPLSLFVHGRRVECRRPFEVSPLQSDYTGGKWEKKKVQEEPVRSSRASFRYLRLWQEMPRAFRQWRRKSLRNRKFFRPIEP